MALADQFNLSGRKALVTGSSRGIGRAIVLGLAEAGADVVIHCASNVGKARSAAEKAAASSVRSFTIQADLGDDDGPQRLFQQARDQLGRIDILVLNVSVEFRRPWQEITREEFERQVTINLRASMELMQLALPGMLERKWGRVLSVGSVQQVKPHPAMLVYASTKCALLNMVQDLAKQIANQGVTLNNLAPGAIDTDRNAEVLADVRYRRQVLDRIPSRRIGQPGDCVGAALLLCSEAGGYINGINLLVDGGMHLL